MASESWGGTQLVALGSVLFVLAAAAHAADDVASSATEIRPLLIGTIVPELTLKAANGNAFDLNGALSQKPAVLIFYRGGW